MTIMIEEKRKKCGYAAQSVYSLCNSPPSKIILKRKMWLFINTTNYITRIGNGHKLCCLQLLEHKLDKLLTSCVCIIETIGNMKLAGDAALLDLEFTKAAILASIEMY